MQLNPEINNLPFDLPKNKSNVIKVIGVGGGGSNAINYMHSKGIKGVDFVVCNTDSQALENSKVENKIQLGISLTEGLGAGANPEIGEKAAVESFDDLKKMLETNTKMVFITAGMGGGTGTGAAPVISKLAKEMDILTVGIVTMPFQFEGKVREEQAKKGIDKLKNEVDALIVINNNKLRDIYGNLGFKEGFAKADEVLATASKGIAEVITHHYTQNIDLKDAKKIYELFIEKGKDFNLSNCGMHAMDIMRMESGFLHWGHDISPEENQYQAGLSFTISNKKEVDFIGKQALEKIKKEKIKNRFAMFILKESKPGEPLLLHDEPIYLDDKIIGRSTSGNYSFNFKKNLVFGYINSDFSDEELKSKNLFIEVEKQKYPISVQIGALKRTDFKNL